MTKVREPAPLAPPEDEEAPRLSDPETGEGVAISDDGSGVPIVTPLDDEATPLPPNVPHHLADPTGYSIEKFLPPELEVVHPEDDATIPEHVRSTQLAPPDPGDGAVEVDVDLLATPRGSLRLPPEAEDELTRPRVRMTPEGPVADDGPDGTPDPDDAEPTTDSSK